MPNAGEGREADIVSHVKETANHPKALLLGTISALCSSPNETVSVASGEELGLSVEEIRLARWVALFKKGKTRGEFLAEIKGLLDTHKPKEEPEMATVMQKGAGYYNDKLVSIVEDVFGIKVDVGSDYNCGSRRACLRGGILKVIIDDKVVLKAKPYYGTILFNDSGFNGGGGRIDLYVGSRDVMKKATRIKRRLETVSKKTQNKPTKFVVLQNFA